MKEQVESLGARFLDLVIWRTLRTYSNLANVGAAFLNVDSDHITSSSHAQTVVDLFARYQVNNNANSGAGPTPRRPARPVQRLYPSNSRVPYA